MLVTPAKMIVDLLERTDEVHDDDENDDDDEDDDDDDDDDVNDDDDNDDDDDDDEDDVGIPGAEGESLKAAPSPSALRSAEEDDVAAGVATPPLFKAGSFPRRIIASTSS